MKYPYLEPLNAAQVIARATYRNISETAVGFFRDLGGFENLPEGFNVIGEGWTDVEREIDEAAQAGDIEKTLEACQRYERRALAYFEAWLKKLEKQKGASA